MNLACVVRLSCSTFLMMVPAIAPAQTPTSGRIEILNDGWRLVGDLTTPVSTPARRSPAILMLNGAGRDRGDYETLARRLAALGIGSLRLDMRGMGASVNKGRFVPFDSTGQNAALGIDRNYTDVQAALRYLARLPWVDRARMGAVGASFSGEALARAIRGSGEPRAVVVLSPGSFSDTSLADVDRDGRHWLFVYSSREMLVRRFQHDQRTRRGSDRARVIVVADSGHASQLLRVSPQLDGRLAEWFSRALADSADERWRRAADRVAALIEPGWDDLREPGVATMPLGDGVAGRLHFMLARHRTAMDSTSHRAARRAADQLLSLLPPRSDSGDVSMYRGLAGAAIVLLDASDALRDQRYRVAATELLARIRDRMHVYGTWSGANDVLTGDAGTTAVVYSAARRLGDSSLRNLAFASARSLLTRARPDSGGMNWRWREASPLVLPNFTHGAAGIGTVFARVGSDLDAPLAFLDAARAAGRYVSSVALNDARGFRVPYGWPVPNAGWGRPFDASWGHGQAGTIRLYWALWQATRDTSYLAVIHAAVRGIDSAHVLSTPSRDYGAAPFSIDYRFGLAGIADVFADLYDETGDRTYLMRALTLATEIVRRGDSATGPLGWTRPREVFLSRPGEPALMTGLFHGAAGPGLLFLKLDALLHGRRPPVALPDSPFGDRW